MLKNSLSHLETLVEKRNKELETLHEIYNIISDDIPVCIWRTDSNGFINYKNKKMTSTFKNSENIHISEIIQDDCQKDEFLSLLKTSNKCFDFVFSKNDCYWYKIKVNILETGELIGTILDVTSKQTTIPQLLTLKKEIKDIFKNMND